MDILNLEEQLNKHIEPSNEADLREILHEFKEHHFPNVIDKLRTFIQDKNPSRSLKQLLRLVESVCLAQLGENEKASRIIQYLYKREQYESIDDLLLYGELAFMANYKLSRRIMAHTVRKMNDDREGDRLKLARGYLVLGETEERLDKFKRAIKYFKQGLSYFTENDVSDQYMVLYLNFKLGMLYSVLHKRKQAITYLKKALHLASDKYIEIQANCLLSLARLHIDQEEKEEAYYYLKKAIARLQDSFLNESYAYAEILLEKAFYYFNESMYDQAVPFYKQSISIFNNFQNVPLRKLGMIYMQYAYSLNQQTKADNARAGWVYERAIEKLEKTNDRELLENALVDVVQFFKDRKNNRKQRQYENKLVKLMNA